MRMSAEQVQMLSQLNGGNCLPLLQSTVYRADRNGIDDTELDFLVNYGRAVQLERDHAKAR